MQISGAQAVLKILKRHNNTVIFGYPGAANAPIYDKMKEEGIEHILVRQEQSAGHAASGYARLSGRVGVCIATSGPGATNLLTAIATAYCDSIPVLFITGQVERRLIGTDAFQEVDIKGATSPFCKHNYLVEAACELPQVFEEAYYIAATGRPGPVVIDIPVDVQNEVFDYEPYTLQGMRGYKPVFTPEHAQVQAAAEAIRTAKKPLLIAGGGIIGAGAETVFCRVAKAFGIPVVTTLMGVAAIEKDNPLCLGMIGMHGMQEANRAVAEADLLILCGCRVGERALANSAKISGKTKIVHCDIDPAEVGKNLAVDYPVIGDIGETLALFEQEGLQGDFWPVAKPEPAPYEMGELVNPKYVMHRLSVLTEGKAALCGDVGQNQIWTAKHYNVRPGGKLLMSCGLGTMGYSIPAAVGAAFASDGRQVIAVCGDGGFQMLMQELGTIRQQALPVKIILFRNDRLGMVYEIQRNRYNSNFSGTILSPNPDFQKIAEAYGIPSVQVAEGDGVEAALSALLAAKGAFLAEFVVSDRESSI